MKRIFATKLTPKRTRASRRGAATGMLLLMLVFLSGFVALGVNVVRLRQIQGQLRTVCRSAALAGAAELLDEGSLCGCPDVADDAYAARRVSAAYARMNGVDGRPVQLDPNFANQPKGDVVIGWYDPSGPVGRPIVLPTAEAPCEQNTVRVTARMSRNLSNRVTLWFGCFVGLNQADVAATAQASLDRRVCGFRAEPHVKVPVVPLAAEHECWFTQALAAAAAGLNDCFAVDPQSGAVTGGSDGVPEVILKLANKGASEDGPWCAALALPRDPDSTSENVWYVRCLAGLSQHDLAAWGGEFVTPPGGRDVPLELPPPTDVPYALMEIVGQCRAWPLAVPGPQGAKVLCFAAGRIVAVRPAADSNENEWEIVVQPSTLVSSQAVASVHVPVNPWIAKLELTQ